MKDKPATASKCHRMPTFMDELNRRIRIYDITDASLIFEEGERIGYDLTAKAPSNWMSRMRFRSAWLNSSRRRKTASPVS